MPKNVTSDKFKQAPTAQLQQNYAVLYQLVPREQLLSLKYQQIMFILFNGKVSLDKISYWKSKNYKDQQPLMRKSFLINDGVKIRREIVAKAWRFQKAASGQNSFNENKKQKIQNKIQHTQRSIDKKSKQMQINNVENEQLKNQQEETKNKQIQNPSPTQSQRHTRSLTTKKPNINKAKQKKMKIQQMMQNLQAKMNITRNQVEAAKYQKQYNKYFKELTDLRNRKRIQSQAKLFKRIEQQNSKGQTDKLKQIIDQINIIKNQNAKILDKQPVFKQKITKIEQIERLNIIFFYYCKKQSKNTNRYFSDLQKSHSILSLQSFLKFAQDWNLNRILEVDQITKIFKSHSKGPKFINNHQFIQILNDIHKCQCIKQQKPITSQSISQYIQQFIVCEQKIKSKIYGYSLSPQINNNSNKNENYRFKPKSHSGKYLHDIEHQIQQRKQTIQFLAGPKNLVKYKKQNNFSKNQSNSQTLANSRLEMKTLSQSSSLSPSRNGPYNPTNMNSLNESVNSYAFRFKLKNIKNRIKTQGVIKSIQNTVQCKNKGSNIENLQNTTLNILQYNRQNISNRNRDNQFLQSSNGQQQQISTRYQIDDLLTKKQKNSAFQGFQDLIEQSQQDEYLNKHLQLPPIRGTRVPSRNIHY